MHVQSKFRVNIAYQAGFMYQLMVSMSGHLKRIGNTENAFICILANNRCNTHCLKVCIGGVLLLNAQHSITKRNVKEMERHRMTLLGVAAYLRDQAIQLL